VESSGPPLISVVVRTGVIHTCGHCRRLAATAFISLLPPVMIMTMALKMVAVMI
jgi:hypothetical protein